LVVIGIEPEEWLIESYPPEAHAPNVTARIINIARKRRGEPPVPKEAEKIENHLSLNELRRISARIAA